MQQVLLYTKDNIMYCMISIKDSDRPEILKIQGVTWFETQELAYQYYMFLKPELREEYVYPVEEQDLPSFENITPEDVKVAKYKTRLISNTPEPGVTVYNNGE